MEGKENIREKLEKLLLDGRVQRTVCSSNGSPVSTFVTAMVDPDIVPILAEYLSDCGVSILPVKVGDTVYATLPWYGKDVKTCSVVKSKAVQFKDGTIRYFLDVEFDIEDPFYRDGRLMRCGAQAVFGADFGDWRRAYLTREEAEAANKAKGV